MSTKSVKIPAKKDNSMTDANWRNSVLGTKLVLDGGKVEKVELKRDSEGKPARWVITYA
ncbi:MAG: hypothetical protein AAGB34_06375 [Planctomycetota bacterium]